MRRYLYIIGAVITAMLSSCSNDIEEVADPSPKMVDIAIVAQTEEEVETRLDVEGNTTRWEVGDNLSLYLIAGYNNTATATLSITSASDISDDGKRAVFRGSVPEGYYYGVTALYPAVDNSTTTPTLDREAANNIFMASFKQYDNTLQVTANSEIPISFSHLMHKVDYHLSLADGYISDDLNAESIAVEMTATTQGTPIEFVSKASYNVRSNTISASATTKSIITHGKGNELQTMLFPMNTTKGVAFTFNIYINGEKRYEIKRPDSGTINTFKMSAGKTTNVNLVLSKANSVGGGDIIEQRALILSASKSSIDANGVDSAKLSVVEEGGGDVTAQCTLYMNGGTKLTNSTFATTTPGTYTLYAERNGVRSNSLTITAREVTTTGTTTVFAEGVTLTSGWYDTNKRGNGQTHGDIMMCWAASAANIIEWWQDRYQAAGKSLPQGATTGPGDVYELKTMELFKEQWTTLERGAQVFQAVTWYFEGTNLCKDASPGTSAQPVGAGGYYSSLMTDLRAHMYCGYDYLYFTDLYSGEINNYYHWGNGSGLTGTDRLKAFSNIVVDVMDKGVASMAVALSANLASGHHATTLWGYEIDNATGLITRLWITDSDDLVKDPKEQLLNEYSVSMSSAGTIELKGNTRYQLWVVGLQPMSGYQR